MGECKYCKNTVSRFISKGDFCSVDCFDRYEYEQEVKSLQQQVKDLEAENRKLKKRLEVSDLAFNTAKSKLSTAEEALEKICSIGNKARYVYRNIAEEALSEIRSK